MSRRSLWSLGSLGSLRTRLTPRTVGTRLALRSWFTLRASLTWLAGEPWCTRGPLVASQPTLAWRALRPVLAARTLRTSRTRISVPTISPVLDGRQGVPDHGLHLGLERPKLGIPDGNDGLNRLLKLTLLRSNYSTQDLGEGIRDLVFEGTALLASRSVQRG